MNKFPDKALKIRKANYPIEPLILGRFSPRAMSGEPFSDEELMPLFEAARWAPSCYNEQPWLFLCALKGSKEWPSFFNLLVPFNQSWAHAAGALVVITSKRNFSHNNKPSITHSFDTGAAWMALALEGFARGYVVHGMGGFDYEAAKKVLCVPDDYCVEAMIAIGKMGDPQLLPPELAQKEVISQRKELSEIFRVGGF